MNLIYVKQGEFVFDFSSTVQAVLKDEEIIFNPFINSITAQTSESGYTLLQSVETKGYTPKPCDKCITDD